MKITKQGTPPEDRLWSGRCYHCKSEATAKQSELHKITRDQREGGSFSWEVCPVCGAGDKITGYGGMIFYPSKA